MMEPTSVERLEERGQALWAFERAVAGSPTKVVALLELDRRVRHAEVTDWPGRGAGPELRNGIPDLDLAPADPPDEGEGGEPGRSGRG